MKKFWNAFAIAISVVALFATLITQNPLYLCIVGGSTLILVILSLFLYDIYNTSDDKWIRKLKFKLRKESDFYYTSRSIVYTYINITDKNCIRKSTIKVLQNGLQHIDERYNWSGNMDNDLVITANKPNEIINRKERSRWDVFTINFDKPYSKGETISTVVTFPKMNGRSKKFLSTSISKKTEKLHLKVCFPKDFQVVDGEFNIYNGQNINEPIKVEELNNVTENGNIILSKEIEYPRLGWRYEIVWNFKDN